MSRIIIALPDSKHLFRCPLLNRFPNGGDRNGKLQNQRLCHSLHKQPPLFLDPTS